MKPMQFETEVTQIIWRTKDAKSVRFRRPEGFEYLPGQWIFLTLGRGEERKTKQLSLSSSPTEDSLEVTKRLTGHEFSKALDALRIGDTVSIRGPNGTFTFQGEYDKVCMLAGGIGITPQRSMIRYATDKALKTSIILLYSNRYEDNIAFEDDFDEMQRSNRNFKLILTITQPSQGWKGRKGRISRDIVERAVPDYAERVFYTSGPAPMLDAMSAMLREIGLPEAQIKFEYFTGYAGAPKQ